MAFWGCVLPDRVMGVSHPCRACGRGALPFVSRSDSLVQFCPSVLICSPAEGHLAFSSVTVVTNAAASIHVGGSVWKLRQEPPSHGGDSVLNVLSSRPAGSAPSGRAGGSSLCTPAPALAVAFLLGGGPPRGHGRCPSVGFDLRFSGGS